MQCEKLFKRIEELKEEYIRFWVDVVNLESPTDDKAGVDAVGRYFAEKGEARGWKVEVHHEDVAGDLVCLTMNPDAPARPVVFSGHMDTVHPVGLFGTPAAHLDENYIYGPGSQDCKGGCVASFLAMAAMQDVGFTTRPVKLVLQSDEETGNRNSQKDSIRYMAKVSEGCAYFLNTEGYSKDTCTLERKGIRKYRFTIHGKACHASGCYAGVSAIAEAARKITELEQFKEKNGVTANVGLIEGGTSVNTVPAKCTFMLDMRIPNLEEGKKAEAFVKKTAETSFIPGTTCELELLSFRDPMQADAKNLAALETVNRIFAENGLPTMGVAKRNGASDAQDLSALGVTCLDSLGTEGAGSHSIEERAELASLVSCAKRLAAAAYCLKD